MNLVAGAIEESGVDEDNALGCAADALCEVHGRTPLLIHDAHFEGVTWQAKGVLNCGKQIDRHADFVGSVHLGFHNVHGACTGVAAFASASKVMK